MASSAQRQGSFSVGSRTIPPGAPFPVTSADNGLSVDPVTGRIVLGNDIGGTTAMLLSAREIDFNANSLQFIDSGGIGQPGTTLFSDGYFQVLKDFPFFNGFFGSAGDLNGDIQINSDILLPGSTPPRLAFNNGSVTYLQNSATGFEVIDTSTTFRSLRLDQAAGAYWMGDIDNLLSGTMLRVNDAAGRVNARAGVEFVHTDPATNRFIQSNPASGFYKMGDIDGAVNNMILFIDDANQQIQLGTNLNNGTLLTINDLTGNIEFTNGAGTALIRANGVNGFTGTVAPVNTITVNGGIVTNVA